MATVEDEIAALSNELQETKNDFAILAQKLEELKISDQKSKERMEVMSLEAAPVGSIVAFAKVAALPANWKSCDGSTIDDNESPLHGQVTPNIKDSRYLVGVEDAFVGSSVGRNDWEKQGSHTHSYSGRTDNIAHPSNFGGDGSHSVQTTHGENLHKVAFDYSGTTASANHDHGEKRPLSIGVQFAMRIK